MYVIFFSFTFIFLNKFPTYVKSSILLSRGIYWIDFNEKKFIVSLIFLGMIFLVFNWCLGIKKTISSYLILLLFILGYIPESIIFFSMNLEYKYFILMNIFWFILFLSTGFLKKIIRQDLLTVGTDKQRQSIFITLLTVFSLVVLYIFIRYGNFKFNFTLNLENIYDLRIEARNYNMSKFIDFIRNNAMYIIYPTASLIFLSKKKYGLFFLMIVFQMMLYSIDNQKAAIFLIILSIVGYYLYNEKFFYKISNYFFYLAIFVLFFGNVKVSIFIMKNFFERIIFLPAILNYNYYSFFNNNESIIPFVSLFKKMGIVQNYPYDDGISFIMGDLLFNNRQISANTGSFGNAFSYGIIGLILIPILFGLLFVLLDISTNRISNRILISLIFIQVFVFLNVSIFIIITSYGLILAIVVLSLINNNKYYKELE